MALLEGEVLHARNLEGICLMIAASAKFRSITGAANAADALTNYIHFPEADDTRDPRPRAIVQPGDFWSLKQVGVHQWQENGNCHFSFEFPSSTEYLDAGDDTDAERREKRRNRMLECMNRCWTIVKEMRDLSQLDRPDAATTGLTYPSLDDVQLVQGPAEPLEREEGEQFYGVTFEVRW